MPKSAGISAAGSTKISSSRGIGLTELSTQCTVNRFTAPSDNLADHAVWRETSGRHLPYNLDFLPRGRTSGRFLRGLYRTFEMEKHESPQLPADKSLPRPVVLRPEDLAKVAAAGAGSTVPAVASKPIIYGGIRIGTYET